MLLQQIEKKKTERKLKRLKLTEIRNEKETMKNNIKFKRKEIQLIAKSFKEKELELKMEELRMKQTENKLNELRSKLDKTQNDLRIHRNQRDEKQKQADHQLLSSIKI